MRAAPDALTDRNAVPAPRSADEKGRLARLYAALSKHSAYQALHPWLRPLCGALDERVAGKQEGERQALFERRLRFDGARVMDIGANTGYFSFAALAAGAQSVDAAEGNAAHAEFVRLAGDTLGLARRLRVQAGYVDFAERPAQPYDVLLCLNVLHHLGDDFGDRGLDIDAARTAMWQALDELAHWTRHLVLQIGFNWRGDRSRPLFEHGTKAELIEAVRSAAARSWGIEAIDVARPRREGSSATRDVEFVPLDATNLARDDALGEFLNRPVFTLRSRVIGRG